MGLQRVRIVSEGKHVRLRTKNFELFEEILG